MVRTLREVEHRQFCLQGMSPSGVFLVSYPVGSGMLIGTTRSETVTHAWSRCETVHSAHPCSIDNMAFRQASLTCPVDTVCCIAVICVSASVWVQAPPSYSPRAPFLGIGQLHECHASLETCLSKLNSPMIWTDASNANGCNGRVCE